jgi:hypothetical protein
MALRDQRKAPLPRDTWLPVDRLIRPLPQLQSPPQASRYFLILSCSSFMSLFQ